MTLTRRTMIASASAATLRAQDAPPPNIVLIMTDDQGWWDAGVHGNRDIETPVLDKLASESVELPHYHAAPVCAPTRAGMMTGRHYLRTGVYNTRFGGDTLNASETTLAQILQQRGYRTGIFGKWHLGEHRRHQADQRGFDESVTFTPGHTERYYYPDRLLYNGRPVAARGFITDLLTDAAIGFLRANRTRPFFLYVPYNVPHEPHIVDDAHYQRYARKGLPLREARIYGLISQCDWNIGRLLRAIEGQGLRGNTIVIFTSDNGGISRHYTAGLRGGKGSVYEGGTRVPFFVRWPGRLPAGRRAGALASHLDLLPTLADWTGAKLPTDRQIDGRSLTDLLAGNTETSPHEYLFHIWDRFRPTKQSRWAVTGRRYKLVNGEELELFDLTEDPGEQHNLAVRHSGVATEMKGQFDRWFDDVTRGQAFQPVPVEVGGPLENPVDLLASWARTRGTRMNWSHPYAKGGPRAETGESAVEETTNYTYAAYDWDTIDGWSKPGESAWWDIDVAAAANYEVTLVYGCGRDMAGGRFQVVIGPAALTGVVRPTPDRNMFQPHALGRVRLPRGRTKLEVTVVSAPGKELMALNRVRITRLASG